MKKRYYAIIFVLLIYNYDWLFLIYDFCFNKPASTLKETVHYKFLERNFTVKSDGSYAVVEKIQGVMKKNVSENFFYEMRYVNNQNDIKILEAKSIVDGEEYIISHEKINNANENNLDINNSHRSKVLKVPILAKNIGDQFYIKRLVNVNSNEAFPNFFAHTLVFDSLDGAVDDMHININSEIPLYYEFNNPSNHLDIRGNYLNKFNDYTQNYNISIKFHGPLQISNKMHWLHKFFYKNKKVDSSELTWISVSSETKWSDLNKIMWRKYKELLSQSLPKSFLDIANKAILIKDKDDQIEYVLSSVKKIIHYNKKRYAIKGGYLPRDLTEVEKSGYGDCKDFAVVTAVILNKIGYNANIASIDAGASEENLFWGMQTDYFNKFLNKALPDLGIFNHVVVMIKNEQSGREEYWIDPLYGNSIYNIPTSILNKFVLVVNGNSATLKQITHKTILDKIYEGFKEGFIDRVSS